MSLKRRNEIPVELTWDLSALYETEEKYERALEDTERKIRTLYKEKMPTTPEEAQALFASLEDTMVHLSLVSHYVDLDRSGDMTDEKAQLRASKFYTIMNELYPMLEAIQARIYALSEETLKAVAELDESLKNVVERTLRDKEHRLSDETEMALATFQGSFSTPYTIYDAAKLEDMTFESFKAHKKEHPLSFVNFENEYEYHPDKKIRRAAYKNFSKGLRNYHSTIANAYIAKVTQEYQMAKLRGYESVFDYLLKDQFVSRAIYDKHIDTLMEKLSPVMQKWAKLIGKVHGIKKLRYEDLKLPIDPDFTAEISIEEAKKTCLEALQVFGEDYLNGTKDMLENRGIDWAQNIGKSTGGFCASPFGAPRSFILLSWSGLLSEVYTLIHELGHAGHFRLANRTQRYLNTDPSTYFVEAPSTMNELILTNYLLKQSDDPRYKRYVITSLVGNTYYHNAVTHFIEAYYQREVYRALERGEGLHPARLDELMLETLKKFWGDTVKLDDNAALTWMRQPHYYMGLYSYTYSAGLSIATAMNKRIQKEGESATKAWLEALSTGGIHDPKGFAKVAGVDIEKTDFLLDTISYIDELIEEASRLTKEMK
ncbi:oligoendopeptidase F [Guggenheimella bovis]